MAIGLDLNGKRHIYCGNILWMKRSMEDVPSSIGTAILVTTPNHDRLHQGPSRMCKKITPWVLTESFGAASRPGSREVLTVCYHHDGKHSLDTKLGPAPVTKTLVLGCMGEGWIPT